MARQLSIGDEAPNFDLTSTENVILMLRDEVPRTAVLLYFFADGDSDEVRNDLVALGRWRDKLLGHRAKILAVSPLKVDPLKKIQQDLKLRFPLLSDDRNFSAAYGVEPAGEDAPARPALFLVDRDQSILWSSNPVGGVEQAMGQIEGIVKSLSSSTTNYEKSVVNRVVDWWVH